MEFTFSDKEFDYLGYYLFTIDGDDPEDWEDFSFDKETLDLYHKLYNTHLERECLLTLEGKKIDDNLDNHWIISLSEEQIDTIIDMNEDALRWLIDDPEFEEYLEHGNSLLKIFSKPLLSLTDLSDDSSI